MSKIRKGDRVQLMKGKDAGKQGRVVAVHPDRDLVLVQGLNRVQRHEKIRPAQGRSGQTGGITTKEMPIHMSNVALVCRTDGPTRAGFRIEADGTKVRICTKCKGEL